MKNILSLGLFEICSYLEDFRGRPGTMLEGTANTRDLGTVFSQMSLISAGTWSF